MATFYIDPSAGSNGSGTFASPYNTWASVTFAAGNTYLQKGGATYNGQVLINVGGTSEGARVILGSYNGTTGTRETGGYLRAIFNGAGTNQTIRILPGANYVTVDNFEVYGSQGASGQAATGIYIGSWQQSVANYANVTNCWVHDVANTDATMDNNGIQGFGSNCLIEGNTIDHIPSDGIWMQGQSNLIQGNNVSFCSTNITLHNGDCIQVTGDATLHFNGTQVIGNICDHSNVKSKQCIVFEDDDDGTWSSTGGLIEGNTCTMSGADVGATGINAIYASARNIVIRQNRITANCEFGIFLGAHSDGADVHSNLFLGTQTSTCLEINCNSANIYNNTIVGAATTSITGINEEASKTGNLIRNNAVRGYGIGVVVGNGTADHNGYYANTSNIQVWGSGSSGTHNVTAAPNLDGSYKPLMGSPYIGAGLYQGAGIDDLDGVVFANPPAIGTFEFVVSGDATAPTVSITSPTGGTVFGAITLAASASDNVGVVGVQFKLDGVNLGIEDTTSPYSISWDTTTATNGTYSLTAVARDAASNSTTSSAVTVTVSNSGYSSGTTSRPDHDVVVGGWTPSQGSALYAMLDEVAPDDAGYISATTAGNPCRIDSAAVPDPGSSVGHVIKYRAWATAGKGLRVRLISAGQVITTILNTNLPTSPTEFTYTLSTEEADAITDYSDLSFEIDIV